MMAHTIQKISPGIQHYAWGGTRFIPNWLGLENKTDQPYAEAWYGDHPLAPACLAADPHTPLDQWIASNPLAILGAESVDVYGPRMPFLLKILDVSDMLSLQLHPSKKEAIKGYAKENVMQVPLLSPNRNYKDQNHKPELLFALSDFWMLQGFATLEVIKTRFEALLPQFEWSSNYSWRTLMDRIWALDSDQYIRYLDTITNQIQSQNCGDKDDIYHWIEKALQSYPYASGSPDRGILVMMMMHVQHLKPGQVAYQAPGVLHAYLEGQNIELMANSDNVLRGGLTPKHIDPAELMLHLDTTSSGQYILSPICLMQDEIAFSPPVQDFHLKYFPLQLGNTKTMQSDTVSVVLVQKGKLAYDGRVASDGESLIIPAFSTLSMECITDKAAFFLATGSL